MNSTPRVAKDNTITTMTSTDMYAGCTCEELCQNDTWLRRKVTQGKGIGAKAIPRSFYQSKHCILKSLTAVKPYRYPGWCVMVIWAKVRHSVVSNKGFTDQDIIMMHRIGANSVLTVPPRRHLLLISKLQWVRLELVTPCK